mmetsp:Transcript_27951/g.65261  ORF Transcript_27951/g.65261 Transcript_27951/m.65261 type:complete len:237 (+) Transcript_27951:73-783(+)
MIRAMGSNQSIALLSLLVASAAPASPSLNLSLAAPCAKAPLPQVCDDAGLCHQDNMHCPPITTDPTCGEHPHSGRDGSVLTWGLSYKTANAQECCDKCKTHPKNCNSWTFCGLPVCWGLDTGHNHTYGECWLRKLDDVHAASSFRQRGRYTEQWLKQHRRARPGCAKNEPWACSPTHVPYTSGSLGGPAYDASVQHVTGGGWGKVFWKLEREYVAPPGPLPLPTRVGKQRRLRPLP